MNAEDLARLKALKPELSTLIPNALTVFYGKLAKIPALADMFDEKASMKVAKDRQTKHWMGIADANFGAGYQNAVKKIGEVHARIGLDPQTYLGGYSVILQNLIEGILQNRLSDTRTKTPGNIWGWKKQSTVDVTELSLDVNILLKSALSDAGLAISTYLDTLQAERDRVLEKEHRKQQAELQSVLDAFETIVAQLVDGDLRQHMRTDLPEQYVGLAMNMNRAIDAMSHALTTAQQRADVIGGSVREITGATKDLSSRTIRQAGSIEESSAALQEITENVASSFKITETVAKHVSNVADESSKSSEIAGAAEVAIMKMEESSEEIARIVIMIDDIAFQTNLLALNASVEAARAGEAGRGFSVVAQEVRALSQRCADAAGTIKALVETNALQIKSGVNLVGNTRSALEDIATKIAESSGMILDLTTASKEQSEGLRELNQAIIEMDALTQQNANMVENTNSSTQVLEMEIDNLLEVLTAFKTQKFPKTEPSNSSIKQFE